MAIDARDPYMARQSEYIIQMDAPSVGRMVYFLGSASPANPIFYTAVASRCSAVYSDTGKMETKVMGSLGLSFGSVESIPFTQSK